MAKFRTLKPSFSVPILVISGSRKLYIQNNGRTCSKLEKIPLLLQIAKITIEGSKWTFRDFNMTELLVVTRPTELSRASEAMFTMNFVFKDCKHKSLSIVWTLMNFYVI